MKKLILTLVALVAGTSAFANGSVFGPAKPPVQEGTGTFKAQSYGIEVKSVNDIKFVGIYDNKNGNGAAQKMLQSFEFQGVKFYTTATLSTNADVNKAYAGASAMVEFGEADALISGLTRNYASTIRPALKVIGTDDDVTKIAGMYILFTKNGPFFFCS